MKTFKIKLMKQVKELPLEAGRIHRVKAEVNGEYDFLEDGKRVGLDAFELSVVIDSLVLRDKADGTTLILEGFEPLAERNLVRLVVPGPQVLAIVEMNDMMGRASSKTEEPAEKAPSRGVESEKAGIGLSAKLFGGSYRGSTGFFGRKRALAKTAGES